MTQSPEQGSKDSFLADANALQDQPAPAWLQSVRAEGRRRFGELEFPHRRMEAWKYTNVAPIVRKGYRSLLEPAGPPPEADAIAPFLFEGDAWTQLVFVDGFHVPELSSAPDTPGGVKAISLREAGADEQALLEQHLGQHLNGAGTVFSALNEALVQDGALVHIPRDARTPGPVHLLFVSTGAGGDTARHPRTLVVAESQAEADVIEHYVHLDGGAYFTNAACEYHLGPNAHLRHIKLVEEAPEAYHLSATRVSQQRDSVFSSHVFSLGGRIVRNEIISTLDEENAEARFSGLYLADEGQLVDNYLDVRHQAPHCTSYLGYKGVLDGKSNGVFTGRVYVQRHAQKTDSNQLNQNLLLSPKATVDTRPQLEIYADDVKCTHGATVGPPPPEQLFYFQTRGMSQAMARAIMTYGFADEVVRKLPVEAVRQTIERQVFDKYSPV